LPELAKMDGLFSVFDKKISAMAADDGTSQGVSITLGDGIFRLALLFATTLFLNSSDTFTLLDAEFAFCQRLLLELVILAVQVIHHCRHGIQVPLAANRVVAALQLFFQLEQVVHAAVLACVYLAAMAGTALVYQQSRNINRCGRHAGCN
jgi:hypothetical protein